MPKVGKMTFPYTAAGKMAAKKAAYKTGEKMESKSEKIGAAYDGNTMVQAKKIDKPTATVMRELKEAGIQ